MLRSLGRAGGRATGPAGEGDSHPSGGPNEAARSRSRRPGAGESSESAQRGWILPQRRQQVGQSCGSAVVKPRLESETVPPEELRSCPGRLEASAQAGEDHRIRGEDGCQDRQGREANSDPRPDCRPDEPSAAPPSSSVRPRADIRFGVEQCIYRHDRPRGGVLAGALVAPLHLQSLPRRRALECPNGTSAQETVRPASRRPGATPERSSRRPMG